MNPEFVDVGAFLFEKLPEGWYPQFAVGRANKQALGWYPGKTVKHCIPKAPLAGFTQLGFQHQDRSVIGQPAKLCWLGMDIDVPVATPALESVLASWPEASARASTGGLGVHVIFRLAEPIDTTWQDSRRVVMKLTKPLVQRCPFPVDKADRRIFWMVGGKNRWIRKSPAFYTPSEIPSIPSSPSSETITPESLATLSPGVAGLLVRMIHDDIVTKAGNHIPCHAGTVIQWLRNQGWEVKTKSPMANEPHINAYLDVSQYDIRLWTYADHAEVWHWQDSEAMLANMIGGNSD